MVATEVKKIAEQSSKAAEKIGETIEEMDNITNQAATEFGRMAISLKSNIEEAP